MRDEYDFIKVDVAIEIIAEMIADASIALSKETDQDKIKELETRRKLYKKQRDQIYSFDMDTVQFVIDIYGAELKKQR